MPYLHVTYYHQLTDDDVNTSRRLRLCPQYSCDRSSYKNSRGAFLTATVSAVMSGGAILKDTMRYEADATLFLTNSSVEHRISSSNRNDYLNRTLKRRVFYDTDTNLLTLTPEEKILGVSFALLWKPSTVEACQLHDLKTCR